MAELAEQASLSSSQLQGEFSSRFGITPDHDIREVRIGVARHLPESDRLSMAQIDSDGGFYDQSCFLRQFKKSTELSPLQYRRRCSV
ncbi:MAG: AraC family transcriptional regulator [Fuerstiella sp.]|nr:AraC family transcriptional regulator [Fuerstiella sp.]